MDYAPMASSGKERRTAQISSRNSGYALLGAAMQPGTERGRFDPLFRAAGTIDRAVVLIGFLPAAITAVTSGKQKAGLFPPMFYLATPK